MVVTVFVIMIKYISLTCFATDRTVYQINHLRHPSRDLSSLVFFSSRTVHEILNRFCVINPILSSLRLAIFHSDLRLDCFLMNVVLKNKQMQMEAKQFV